VQGLNGLLAADEAGDGLGAGAGGVEAVGAFRFLGVPPDHVITGLASLAGLLPCWLLTVPVTTNPDRTIRPQAAPGVDGVTWHAYGQGLEVRLQDLHDRVQSGRYRASASRRVYIPKADGRLRPLGIATLETRLSSGRSSRC